LNNEKLIEFFMHEESKWSSRGYEVINIPFDVSPEEYLKYAEKDINIKDAHNLINALSNTKRALDCQVECLLIAIGQFELAKRKKYNIPKKIEVLKDFGIIAPRILTKITNTRNVMEHNFQCPDMEKVNDFLDITTLFIEATNRFVYAFPGESQIENDIIQDYWIDVEINNKSRDFTLSCVHRHEPNEEITIFSNDNNYPKLMKAYLKLFNNE